MNKGDKFTSSKELIEWLFDGNPYYDLNNLIELSHFPNMYYEVNLCLPNLYYKAVK